MIKWHFGSLICHLHAVSTLKNSPGLNLSVTSNVISLCLIFFFFFSRPRWNDNLSSSLRWCLWWHVNKQQRDEHFRSDTRGPACGGGKPPLPRPATDVMSVVYHHDLMQTFRLLRIPVLCLCVVVSEGIKILLVLLKCSNTFIKCFLTI